jgi:hypothetical protein
VAKVHPRSQASNIVVGMARRLPGSSTALLLCLCWLAWTAPAGSAGTPRAQGPSRAPLGGVDIAGPSHHSVPAHVDEAVAAALALHAKIVRAEVPWSALEPLRSGQIDPAALAFTDRIVNDAAADGMRVIMLVDSTPCWASSAPEPLLGACDPNRFGRANAWPPSQTAGFAAFVAYLAQRYGTHLAALEIWNEPDHSNEAYFAGPSKATRYAALLQAAYTAIKQASPRVAVLAGSLVGSDGRFLRELYAAGIKGYYDGLSVHFYDLTLAALRAIHEVQLANADATPLWLDEFGWTSCWPRERIQQEQACVTAQAQAANLADVFHALARTPYIAGVVAFKLQDSAHENFGALTVSGARKPAFAALARVLAVPFGSPHKVTLHLATRRGRVIASGSGPVGDYMQLEAFHAGVLRYRALFTLDRFNRYSLALPHVLGSRGLRVRVFQFWAGLNAGVQKSI